jgi:AcrR family transcriptional regulator
MAQARKAATREKVTRLDADAWIAAAFDALAEGGVDAVRVEPLAKALGITKGSFYWHFADRRALIDAMLASWADGRIAAIREQSSAQGAPEAVLRALADLYPRHANVRGLSIELAIRALARSDEDSAKAVRAVDRERLRHVGDLFAALGWPRAGAQARAILFYSYLFGQSLLDAKIVPPAERERAIEALIRPAI